MEMVIIGGADLKAERVRRGLTQKDLAVKAGLTHASRHVYKIEEGDLDMRLSTAIKLSRALLSEETDLPPGYQPLAQE